MVLLETGVGLQSVNIDQLQVVSEPRWRRFGWQSRRIRVLYLPGVMVSILDTPANLRRLEQAAGCAL